MLSKANFLILDEPTNHLDMMSKEVLENALNQYEGTILYVSHDRYFINQTATKVLDMQKDHMSVYLGDYDCTSGTQQSTTTSYKEDWQKQKELQNRIKKLQSTLTSIEEKIELEEGKLAELDEQLCLEEVYTNPDASRDIMNQKAAIEENIASLYTNWEETSEELEILNS